MRTRSLARRGTQVLAAVVLTLSGANRLDQTRASATPAPTTSVSAVNHAVSARSVIAGHSAGYWMAATDGGVYQFGTTNFGGLRGLPLNRPVVGMAATPDGGGYWLVASDGGIFAFRDARFYGSTGNLVLNQPIVGMGATPTGNGYWLAARDGGIFTFGDAGFLGSTGGQPGPAPMVTIATTASGSPYPPGATGYDISFPDCNNQLPPPGSPVSIVGVNGGLIDNFNPCFAAEAAAWAGPNLSVYINVNLVPDGDPTVAMNGPAGACARGDLLCEGYNWGFNYAAGDLGHVHSRGFQPQVWWLDVEQPCGYGGPLWRCGSNQALASNGKVIQGALDALHSQGLTAGIYSTYLQWPATVGPNMQEPGIPIWIGTVPQNANDWAADCNKGSLRFAGGVPWLIQWLGGASPTGFDQDYACAH